MADYETLHACRLHMRDGAIHYKLYLLKLTMAVDNILFRIIKGLGKAKCLKKQWLKNELFLV